jgi:ligand-binding sensor domain-containing protein/signal transduction histidine kinase
VAAGALCLASLSRPAAHAAGTDSVGADFLVSSWHTESGLPNGNVTALAQTPDGYVWVGTFKGLARFDGVSFTVFDTRRDPALIDEQISGLLVDSRGRLWVACESGALLSFEQGHFQPRLTPQAGSERRAARSTHSRWLRPPGMAEDARGGVWVQDGRPGLLHLADGVPEVCTTNNGLPAGPVFGLVNDPARRPWLLAGETLHRWQAGHWTEVLKMKSLGGSEPVFCAARDGGLWIAAARGSWSFGGGRVLKVTDGRLLDQLEPTPWATNSPRSQVTALLEDRDGRLWLGTQWGGVLRSDSAGHWQHPLNEGPLAQCRVTCLLEDRQGAIWVGTIGDGLHRLVRRPVTTLRLPEPAREHLVNTVCAARDGGVWAGTDGAGLFRHHEGRFTHFGAAEGLASELVLSVLEDRQTNLWCGTAAGLFRWQAGRFQRVDDARVSTGSILALFEDREGDLWIGTHRGPVRWQAGTFTAYELGPGLGTVEIRCLAQDLAGRLWVGTIAQGAFCLSSNRVEHFAAAQGLLNPDARSLCCDTQGGVWIGTLGGGLFRFKAGRFQAITTTDGLPDDTINGILESSDGGLWMSSYNGFFGGARQVLDRYERGRETALVFRRLSLAEGLDYRACSGAGQPVVSRAPDGRIWFVNQRSVAVLDPRAQWGPPSAPNVLVEAVVVDGESFRATASEPIRAPSSARQFEFQYTALHMPRPEQARFRYRLEGFDAGWNEAGVRRAGYYSQLPPGLYQFHVAAAGDDGAWHEAARALSVQIVPRLWERTSARVAASLLLGGSVAAMVWGMGRARLRRRLEALERQRALEQERSRIARDMHDEVGARLTQISLLSALATGNAEDAAEVRAQNDKIAGLARDVVRSLDGIVWAVRPQNDNLESLVEYLGNATRGLCEGSGVRCWFSVPPEVPLVEISANLRHNLLLACREAVNNVLKHSGATELRMTIRLAAGTLAVEIADNGRGFDVATGEAKKSGLLNMRVRLAEIGGRCDFHSAASGGTRVRFTLPLGTAAPQSTARP